MPTIMNLKRAEIIAAQLKAIQVPEDVIKPLRKWVEEEKEKLRKAEIEKHRAAPVEVIEEETEPAGIEEKTTIEESPKPPGPKADKKRKSGR